MISLKVDWIYLKIHHIIYYKILFEKIQDGFQEKNI